MLRFVVGRILCRLILTLPLAGDDSGHKEGGPQHPVGDHSDPDTHGTHFQLHTQDPGAEDPAYEHGEDAHPHSKFHIVGGPEGIG